MIFEFRVSLLVVLAVLSGCSNPAVIKQESLEEIRETLNKVNSRVAGTTSISFSRQHGTQVSYKTSDGAIYLWYPGNESVLRGEWKARISPDYLKTRLSNGNYQVTRRSLIKRGRTYTSEADICYKYPTGSENPVTAAAGGRWECALALMALPSKEQTVDGDPFELATRTQVPFVTDKEQSTYLKLRRQAGL